MHRWLLFSTCVYLILALLTPRHVPADPPDRLNIGGIEDLVTTIEIDGERRITAEAPAGDVDGDGLDDLLLRMRLKEWSPGDEDLVVLLYGMQVTPGPLDPLGAGVPRTLIGARLGGWRNTSQGLRRRARPGRELRRRRL